MGRRLVKRSLSRPWTAWMQWSSTVPTSTTRERNRYCLQTNRPTVKYKNICQNEYKERMNLTIVSTGILYIGGCIYQYSSTTKIISMNVLDCDFVYRWKKLCRWEQTLLNPWKTWEWLWSQSPWKRLTDRLWLAKWTMPWPCLRTTSTNTCPQRKRRRKRMVGHEVVSCLIDKRNKVFHLHDEFW